MFALLAFQVSDDGAVIDEFLLCWNTAGVLVDWVDFAMWFELCSSLEIKCKTACFCREGREKCWKQMKMMLKNAREQVKKTVNIKSANKD